MRKGYVSGMRMFSIVLVVFLLAVLSVSAVTYVTKSTGDQVLRNVLRIYNNSGTTSFFSRCSAGNSIRVIHGDGSVACESDSANSGTMSNWFIGADSGTPEQIENGETMYVYGGTDGIDTVAGATNTVTLSFDGSELPNDDIAESAVGFSTACNSPDKLSASGGLFSCVAESDYQVATTTASNVCYANGVPAVTCDQGADFYWDSANDRLGIGTSSPAYRLHLQGSGNVRLLLSTNAGQTPELNLRSGSTLYNIYLAGGAPNQLRFWSAAAPYGDKVSFTQTRGMGVNTTTTKGALDVIGNSDCNVTLGFVEIPGTSYGVRGVSSASNGIGVYASTVDSQPALFGYSNDAGLDGYAAYSGAYSNIYGVYGVSSGASTDNWGGYFTPDVAVLNGLSVGYINYYSTMPNYIYLGSSGHNSNAYMNRELYLYGGGVFGANSGDNELNVITIPTVAAPPYSCTASTEGGIYFNTSSPRRMVCAGGVWRPEYTPRLRDKDGRDIDYVGIHLRGADGIAKVFLHNYTVSSNFTFYIANTDPEIQFFDNAYLNMRCYYTDDAMRARRYLLNAGTPKFTQLSEDDSDFVVIRQGEQEIIVFEQPSADDTDGCNSVEFEFVASGYYEREWVNQSLVQREDGKGLLAPKS